MVERSTAQAAPPGLPPKSRVRPNKWWMLGAVSVATFMRLLEVTVANVALPDIQQSLDSSFFDLQWVIDADALTLAVFLLAAGHSPISSAAGGSSSSVSRSSSAPRCCAAWPPPP
jgi:hypothetical protein